MKEYGQFFIASHHVIPPNGFLLNISDVEIQTGDHVKITELHPILETEDAGLADKLFCRGLALNEMKKGKDVLLMVNSETEVLM